MLRPTLQGHLGIILQDRSALSRSVSSCSLAIVAAARAATASAAPTLRSDWQHIESLLLRCYAADRSSGAGEATCFAPSADNCLNRRRSL